MPKEREIRNAERRRRNWIDIAGLAFSSSFCFGSSARGRSGVVSCNCSSEAAGGDGGILDFGVMTPHSTYLLRECYSM
jgi:hypothetical protein